MRKAICWRIVGGMCGMLLVQPAVGGIGTTTLDIHGTINGIGVDSCGLG